MSAPELETAVCPACGAEMTIWARENGGAWSVPRHYPADPAQRKGASSPYCWTSGWSWRSVRSMVRMQQENGGRLLRAAHP